MAEFVEQIKLYWRVGKLIITLPREQKRITPEQIERNIGISKDYILNLGMLCSGKGCFQANQIIKYF